MMKTLLHIRAIILIAIKRLLAQRLLSVATLVGLTIATALILTIPVYSESIAFRILTERLVEESEQVNRPPFSYMLTYIGSWNEPVNWEATEPLDSFIREQSSAELGLDVTSLVRHVETMNMRLFPASETNYNDDRLVLDYVTFGTTDGISDHIQILEGNFPPPADASPDSVIDVLVHQNFASEFGMQVGETYRTYDWRLEADDPMQVTDVRIAGIWQEIDATSSYWFYLPSAFEDVLIVPSETFINRIAPYSNTEINLSVWYLITDGSGVNTSRVDTLIEKHDNMSKRIDELLTGAFIQASPIKQLKPYQTTTNILTLTLTVFSIPVIALLILFLIMIVGLVVERQRNEMAVLRSRGTSPLQIIGLASVEGIILGVIALIIGMGLAIGFSQIMGTTRSFMDFSLETNFIVSMPPTIATTILLALVFTISIRIFPTISASRHTIISYKSDNSRTSRRPIWQRLGVDLLLTVVIGYLYYQIVQQGGLVVLESAADIEKVYDQPLVFMLPPLTILTLTLLMLRLLPLVLRILSGIIQLTNSVGLLIVTRQLERSPQTYYLPLILMISTISLGIYTASFARTIDRYLIEQQFYRTGADYAVRILSSADTLNPSSEETGFAASIPVADLEALDNVNHVARIGEYEASAKLTSGNAVGKFVGIDRGDIGDVVFWREDFSDVRLGYLTNNLAIQPDTVLVSQDFMEERDLAIGDFIPIQINSTTGSISTSLQIVGSLNYFPRWYPERDGVLFVGNLDYIFEEARTELTHRMMLRVDEAFNIREFNRSVVRLGALGTLIDEPFSRIDREQSRPERQGLFGLLSIGFITSSVATMIGFLLYTVFSYQRRYVELGILRAIGLSQPAMIVSVAWELGLLIFMGLSVGLAIGLIVSAMYIPYMQFVSNISGITPPYLVMIAWTDIAQIIGLFVLTFIVIMVMLLVTLNRMRIFEAVKLGETL